MHSGIRRARQAAVFLFFILSLSILLVRLFYLQAIGHGRFIKMANEQHTISIELPSKRGTIFDRRMRPLAVNLNVDSIYANCREIVNKKQASTALSSVLNLNKDYILERLSRDKAFVWIKRKVTADESRKLKRLKLKGIGIIKESKRFYPNQDLAAHVIGVADIDNKGLEGLELLYDRYLKGVSGWLTTTQDARRKILRAYHDELVLPRDGLNLVLTIDEVIQNIAERELRKAYDKYNARSASIVVMNPITGDILALASLPSFNLNAPAKRPRDSVRNRVINDFFEPGSVFKIVTAAAALEENVVDFKSPFFCENGEYRIGRRVLHDHTPHGVLTFKEVIEKSSNIGTVKVAALFGPGRMYKYMKAFGFYDRTAIDLPGEVVGMNRPLSKWSGVSMFAIPMGHEVTTTAIQLASAVSVIADNGYLVRPRIVREIVDERGQALKEFPPRVVRKVISPLTAAKVRSILRGVVESGTGKKARIEEVSAGGKTGTAQKVEQGVYSHERFIASFVGFAPVERPALSIVICVDEPRPVYYGGDVAAPVFKTVMDESLKYLNAKGAL